jgi:hypothetical protein
MNQVERKEMKAVYAITERGGKSYWTRIGIGFVNRDQSITVKLDAVPVSGSIQIREWDSPREYADKKPQDAPPPSAARRDSVDALF